MEPKLTNNQQKLSADDSLSHVNKSTSVVNREKVVLEKILEGIAKGLEKFSPRLPLLDSEDVDNNQISLKAHFKAFETANRLYKWTDPDKSLRFRMSLRGSINEYIDTLPTSISENYKELKTELLTTYHESISEPEKLRFWTHMTWDPDRMTLKEFSALLFMMYKSMNKGRVSGSESDLLLKNRLMSAISKADKKFAQYIALNGLDVDSYQDFVTFCTNKYSVFKQNRDIRKCKLEQESKALDCNAPYRRHDNSSGEDSSQLNGVEGAHHDDHESMADYNEMDGPHFYQDSEDEIQSQEAEHHGDEEAAEVEKRLCCLAI